MFHYEKIVWLFLKIFLFLSGEQFLYFSLFQQRIYCCGEYYHYLVEMVTCNEIQYQIFNTYWRNCKVKWDVILHF